jgi:tetratricopeptide (TPR) repeat protein
MSPARWLAVVALLGLHAALAVIATLPTNATCDETAHLVAGYSYLFTGDFRLVPEHPPLAEIWAAIPLWIEGVRFPALDQKDWWTSNQWGMGSSLLYEAGNDPARLLLAGRSMIAFLSGALGFVVFLWSRRLFGTAGGFISLLLYVFSPTMLAHGALITTDLAIALFLLLALSVIWWVLQRVTLWRAMLGGLVLGGLALSKFSCVVMAPVAGILLVVRLARRRPLPVRLRSAHRISSRAGMVGVLCVVAGLQVLVVAASIWLVYGLRFAAFRESKPDRDRLANFCSHMSHESSWDAELRHAGGAGSVIQWARDHRLLPESYLYGLLYTINSTENRQAFLNGERSMHGFRMFFPYAFLVKTPLPLLGVILLAAWSGVRLIICSGSTSSRNLRIALYRTAPLWVLLVVYWAFSISNNLNIGHRHLLPIYPLLFILCGVIVRFLHSRRRLEAVCPTVLLVLFAVASLKQWPHHLAYFNLIAGGPRQAYRHLVDSSLDWGQDLARLSGTVSERAPDDRTGTGWHTDLYLAYFGSASPLYYGIDARIVSTLPPWGNSEVFPLKGGTYCISATFLQQVYLLPMSRWTAALERTYQRLRPQIQSLQASEVSGLPPSVEDGGPLFEKLLLRLRFGRLCAELRRRVPDAWVGRSLMIYHLTDEEINKALFGPPPELARDRAEPLRYFAEEVLSAGLAAPAVAHYRGSLELRPDEWGTHLGLGKAYARLGEYAEAIKHFREAARLNPRSAEAFAGCSLILANWGRMDEAIVAGREAARLDPRTPSTRLGLAEILLRAGRVTEGINVLTSLVADQPRMAEGHALLGDAMASCGRMEQAVACYRAAVRLKPDLLRAHHDLGTVLAHLKRYDEAIDATERALHLAEQTGREDLTRHIRDRIEQYRKDGECGIRNGE